MLKIYECGVKSCQMAFIPSRRSPCTEHCTKHCCRLQGCPNGARAKRDYRLEPSEQRCVVCNKRHEHFEAFTECDEGCQRVFFQSSAVDPNGPTLARRWLCDPDPVYRRHHPLSTNHRIHRQYCSLRCWMSLEWGAKERQSMSRRETRRRAAQRDQDRF